MPCGEVTFFRCLAVGVILRISWEGVPAPTGPPASPSGLEPPPTIRCSAATFLPKSLRIMVPHWRTPVTRSSKLLVYGMGLVFALILLQKAFIMYTDYLWYQSLGQASVFTTILGSRCLLGILVGGAFFAWLYFNLRLARRPLPGDLTLIGKRLLPTEEREQIETYADKALLIFALTGAVMAGLVASGKWREWLQFQHMVSFGQTDPIFGKDAGFYVFRLPFINYAWQSLFYAVVITIVVATLVHIYQEAVRLVGNTVHAIPRARMQILGLLGLALLIKAYAYRLAEFNLLYSSRGEQFFGPSYADIHGRLPILYVLIGISAIAGIIMLVSTRMRSFNLPIGALAVLMLVSILGGWIYPVALQSIVVKPNQLSVEAPYITNNINATLHAYGLENIKSEQHVVRGTLSPEALARNQATVQNIRLWDHRPLETTFQQTQALRGYYRFSDVDVDRYTVQGQYRQTMLAARELDYSGIVGASWVSQHLLYTHGYGLCLAPVNEIVGDGLPNYWVKNLPVESPVGFKIDRPQLYYYASRHPRLIEYISSTEQPYEQPAAAQPAGPGEAPGAANPAAPAGPGQQAQPNPAAAPAPAPTDLPYVIVNTKAEELDYPATGSATAGGEESNVYTRYSGRGDVQLSTFFRRFCFFMRFRDKDILFTQYLTPQSRILFNRAMPERLMELAPIMGYDPDPYLVIANGKLTWINDAYTATNMYPYAARTGWFGGNYVRNSVKVVTDAYDGVPTFYVMPPSPGQQPDPIVTCWRSVFPTLFTDAAKMDPVIAQHLRYPQLLFRIQAEIYAKYHMKNPQTFFQKEDMWAIPPEVYSSGRREVEAYYINMKLPSVEAGKEEFLLMLPLTMARREDKNMRAWMAARCDAPNYGQLLCYEFPKGALVQGPMQVESRISQDAEISQLITLWGQQQSQIIRGNLLVIPIENSLLYVEPIYLEAPNSPLPQLKLVVLAYEDKIVNAPTLDQALTRLFGESAAPATSAAAGLPQTPPQPTESSTLPIAPANLGAVKEILQQAVALDKQAQAAMAKGDLATYQAKQRQKEQLLENALNTIR